MKQQYPSIVMLYGIPQIPLMDGDYYNYFSWVLKRVNTDEPIYVGGGATDPGRPALTEARTAVEILEKRLSYTGTVIASETGLDAREVLENLSKGMKGSSVQIFCAETHRDLVRFLAWKYFKGNAKVIPLPFPANLAKKPAWSLCLRAMRIPRTLLGIAGVYVPWARIMERWLRKRHMQKMATRPAHHAL